MLGGAELRVKRGNACLILGLPLSAGSTLLPNLELHFSCTQHFGLALLQILRQRNVVHFQHFDPLI